MKKTIYLALLIILPLFNFAQETRRENIEAHRIAFITNRVGLTAEEAKRFWPVYNEYQAELEKIRKERRMKLRDARMDSENLSDKEIEAVVDNEIVFKQKELDIDKKYHAQFKGVLPIRKVAKLYMAEEAFKKELIKRIQDKKPGMR